MLYFFVQSGSSDDDFVEIAAEDIEYVFADALLDFFADDGHVHEELDAAVLHEGEDFLSHDLLYDEGHGGDDVGLDVGECLLHDGGAGQAGEEEDVVAEGEVEEELYHQSVHVGHGEDVEHAAAGFEMLSDFFEGPVEVAGHGAVGYHHSFGEACGAAGVVDQGQCLGGVDVVVDVLLAEVFGVFLAEEFVEVLAGVGELFVV